MPQINKAGYTPAERRRCEAVYDRLLKIVMSDRPDAYAFRRALEAALAEGFPIDYMPSAPGENWTLLHRATACPPAVRAGLLQALIDAGAGVEVQNDFGTTPLDLACRDYIVFGSRKFLDVIDILLTGRQGAQPELSERWKKLNWKDPDQRARRGWLEAYIASWPDRRAENAASAFDYAI